MATPGRTLAVIVTLVVSLMLSYQMMLQRGNPPSCFASSREFGLTWQ